jgi:L-amino acid N-acyltransferase YncA
MAAADWPAVQAIYEEGIATGDATFETSTPSWEAWDAEHRSDWAALSPVSGRCVYGGVAETSVYVASHARGRGVGKALLDALVRESEEQGIWTLQAGIFPENRASVDLHEGSGFRVVGVREKLGSLEGRWRDVLLLERRSRTIGT